MIVGNTENTKILKAIGLANSILEMSAFYEEIKTHVFDKSTANGIHIAKQIKKFRDGREFEVVSYRSRFPSKVNAYVYNDDPTTIYINTRNLSRSIASVVATIIHEMVHAVDLSDSLHSYGHGGNSSAGKANCAPNWIGNHSTQFVDGYKDYNEKPMIKYRRPFWWYLNPRNWF